MSSVGDARPAASWFPRAVGASCAAVVVSLLGAALAARAPGAAALGAATAAVMGIVALRPAVAAYLVVAVTPLIVGIDRGRLIPLVRLNEALLLVVGAGLLGRMGIRTFAGRPPRLRLDAVDAALIAMATASSLLPLVWMFARSETVTVDDLLYALTIGKYYALFVVVRAAVRHEREVRTCLWLSMCAAVLVAVVGILQALGLLGVRELLAVAYAPFQDEEALAIGRATSTIASSIALGDVLAFNLAVALAWWIRGGPRLPLAALASLLAVGTIASGQLSGLLALVIAVAAVGLATGRLGRVAMLAVPVVMAAAALLRPVLERRLQTTEASGLPRSWVGPYGRLANLRTYFWPEIARDGNWLLGVRPSARVPATESWREWVWIESGHTWLLWNGGLPLLLAFLAFLWVGVRRTWRVARARTDVVGVAAIGSFAALCVTAVLMTLDPHLTMRGSADVSFALLALACVTSSARPEGSR